ncbi:T9SS type B sorting domain-containing protein [Tenacibaculum sp. 1B UA]|uniref:T9SS type B sorting domain-containing protein n=1 Tax=Tenacibaculum sp. 1B UA TaxID=2922252 RepID=UPI002A23F6BC|nr:T9SS type B sorting domain-containing protein [Tenacibaculum sp. 1B UA]MDX8553802.1 T9SS type B sorting domain-containing protein [Tenacibaculum sp. 1B UA]
MNKLFFLLLCFFSFFCFSQREADNWFFGDKAGIHFNSGVIDVTNSSQMTTKTGSASISNNQGDLLFYTNGQTIWNKEHKIMENGDGIAGEPELIQPSIIVPKPNSSSIYYIFSTRKTKTDKPLFFPGIYYSEIEISSTYPLGKVTRKNVRLENSTAQRITAVHHKNGKDVWVISYGTDSYGGPDNIFFAFKVTEKGINLPVKSRLNEINPIFTIGEMKASPDGSKVALSTNSFLYIYNFNNTTGILTRFKYLNLRLNFTDGYSSNGLTFSPNSKFLYYPSYFFSSNERSYNIMQMDLNDPREGYFGVSVFKTNPNRSSASAQLGSDGKIYIAQVENKNLFDENGYYTGFETFPKKTLGIINQPNKKGEACDYKHDAINLENGLSYYGLPNFIQSYFRNRIIVDNGCVSDFFEFSLDAYDTILSANWDFGDGFTSTALNPSHKYTTPGKYIVTCKVVLNSTKTTFFKEIIVYSLPELISGQKLMQCDNDNDGISLFNLYNIDKKISNNNTLSYKFYRSKKDAENETNEISNPENFNNESNPQTIFVKAINNNNCIKIESFIIETLFKSSIPISPIVTCKNPDYETNKGDFDLQRKKDEIINQLSLSSSNSLTFYATFDDAQKSSNKLPSMFNSTSTTIWVKIENENGCFGISPIDLIVNHPQINLQDNYTICISPSDHPAIILTADSSNDRFEWKDENNNTISTSNNFTLTREGEFSLTIYKIVNGIECSNSKNFTVNYPPAPDILNVEVNVQSETDNSVYISIDGGSSYEFSLDGTTYVGNGTSHSFNNVQPGIATIYIRDLNKCESPTKASASIVGYPKFLTPNADGFNDYWKVYGVSSNFFKEIDIKIFNRFGKVLYVINDKNTELGWDGTYNNIKLPSNDYWFHAKLKDLNDNVIDKKGHFTLKRN